MEAQSCLAFVMVVLMVLATSAEGRHFCVGGKDGWVLHPSEGYNHWSHRERFQVNDTLIFKFKEGSDSVLVVDKNAYYKCTKTNPKKNLTNGHSEFQFPHSGPFYFISGEADNCEKGQKFKTVVLSVRHHPHHHDAKSPSPAPGPALAPAPSPSAATMTFGHCGVFLGLSVVLFSLGLF